MTVVRIDPKNMGGAPVVAGTSVLVSSLVFGALAGQTIADMAADFELPEDTIRAAMEWASKRWVWCADTRAAIKRARTGAP